MTNTKYMEVESELMQTIVKQLVYLKLTYEEGLKQRNLGYLAKKEVTKGIKTIDTIFCKLEETQEYEKKD